jgi:hypothetical protein
VLPTQRRPLQIRTVPSILSVAECGRVRLTQNTMSSSPTSHQMLRLGELM